ncbi:unnamed protein product [Brachionus calyciflorus]|uniref:Uncharacterized protein n=1 Tax=Brachionus calyciflorus TaxID=104777 RepID=A0A814JLX5_9BILA|nr:unnamed protein product [Brachionus calyciflorus]
MEENRVKNLKQIEFNLDQSKRRQKKYYDQKLNTKQCFKVGSKVWLKNHVTKPGLSRKFTVKWIGPYTIEKVLDELNYVVKRISDDKIFTTHYNRMCQFKETINQPEVEDSKKNELSKNEIFWSNPDPKCLNQNNFLLSFEQCLIENNINQPSDTIILENTVVQNENIYLENSETNSSEDEDNINDPIDRCFQNQSIIDLNRSDDSILNRVNQVNNELGNEGDQNVKLNEGNNMEEVSVTRSGRVVRKAQRLSIRSNRDKSYQKKKNFN